MWFEEGLDHARNNNNVPGFSKHTFAFLPTPHVVLLIIGIVNINN